MIELLESRIAPATLLPGGKGVTFTDPDGDTVTVKTSKGAFSIGDNITLVGEGGGERIYFLTADQTFSGATITVSVKKVPGGDGKTKVTALAAGGVNLAGVSIAGDLESLVVGTGDAKIKAIGALKLGSLGVNQALFGVQGSQINGKFGSISIAGDFANEQLTVTGTGGAVKIGGSVLGSSTDDSGRLSFTNAIASFAVKGKIDPGANRGDRAASIFIQQVGAMKISGDLFGAADITGAGRVTLGTVGTLTLERNLLSQIDITGGARTITIGGDIDNQGSLNANGGTAIGSLRIKGDVFKTSIAPIPLLLRGKVGAIIVEGSFLRDSPPGNPVIFYVGETIKSLVVRGHLDGGGDNAKMHFFVGGLGPVTATKAVGSISIAGSVTNVFFDLLNSGQPAAALPVIGKITVGGDWNSSILSAGTTQGAVAAPPLDAGLAAAPIIQLAPFNPPAIFKGVSGVTLESLTIKGKLGLAANNALSIVAADQVKLLSVAGKKIALNPAIDETRTLEENGAVVLYLAEV